jgi:phosphatidylglycerophosphate synthase
MLMTQKYLHQAFKDFYKPIISDKFLDFLYRKGVKPNHITFVSMFFSAIGLFFLFKAELLAAGIFLAIDRLVDAFDGALARRHNLVTGFGEWLDGAKDHVLFNAYYLFAALGGVISWHLAALTIFVTSASVLLVKVADSKNLKKSVLPYYDASPFFVIGLLIGFARETVIFILVINTIALVINYISITVRNYK